MLALRKSRPAFGLDLIEIEAPARPGPGEIAIDVAAAGVCGSDIHVYEWTDGYGFMVPHLPLTLGHEFAGHVAALGPGVEDWDLGDPVTVWPTVGCGTCFYCLAGRRQDCQERRVIGLHRSGGFAPHVVVPKSAALRLPVETGASVDAFALAEPLAVGLNALDIAGISGAGISTEDGDDSWLLVLGPGPIGLGIAWLARKLNRNVILAGFNDDLRLGVAASLGVSHTLDLRHERLDDAIRRITGRPVVDCVIEATGMVQSVHDGLAVLRSSGVLVVAGIHSAPITLDLTRLVRDKKQLRAAHDTSASAWRRVIELIAAHQTEVERMISHRLPLSAALEGFELAREKKAVKVLLEPARQS